MEGEKRLHERKQSQRSLNSINSMVHKKTIEKINKYHAYLV